MGRGGDRINLITGNGGMWEVSFDDGCDLKGRVERWKEIVFGVGSGFWLDFIKCFWGRYLGERCFLVGVIREGFLEEGVM